MVRSSGSIPMPSSIIPSVRGPADPYLCGSVSSFPGRSVSSQTEFSDSIVIEQAASLADGSLRRRILLFSDRPPSSFVMDPVSSLVVQLRPGRWSLYRKGTHHSLPCSIRLLRYSPYPFLFSSSAFSSTFSSEIHFCRHAISSRQAIL